MSSATWLREYDQYFEPAVGAFEIFISSINVMLLTTINMVGVNTGNENYILNSDVLKIFVIEILKLIINVVNNWFFYLHTYSLFVID